MEPLLLTNEVDPVKEARRHLTTHFTGLALQGLLANLGPNAEPRGVAARACELAEATVKELERRLNL